MSQELKVIYRIGLDEGQLKTAAELYDEAFGKKFAVAIKSRQDRLKLYESAFVGRFAISASVDAKLVGLAGFHTPDGSLTGGISAGVLFTQLGVVRGLRAIAIFSLYNFVRDKFLVLGDGRVVKASTDQSLNRK